ncbi:MAG TPA: hypothetical protein VM344_03150 [Vitreimonas sp.]|nr:hypothetical protein [Vitreimonas sp.]
MHGVWHDALHLAAAAVLVGGGGFLSALSLGLRRNGARAPGSGRRPPADSPPAAADTSVVLVAAALSLGAAAVHLAAAPAHITELGAFGWAFVGVAAYQLSWALAWAIQRSPAVAWLGILGNLAVLAAWLWSRSVGLPVGPFAGSPEPVAFPDGAAAALELLLVGILAARLAGAGDRLTRRLGDLRSLAGVAVVPAVGLVFLTTTLAVTLALGHRHDGDHEHAAPHASHGPVDPR